MRKEDLPTMNILIIGCGRVGSRLASALSQMGHDISVLDRDETAFDALDEDFDGITHVGIPIDQDVLRRAGIEGCDAVVSVTSQDTVNLMVAQLAQEIFKVPQVLSRVYDPVREEVFSEFGLSTVCPTNLSVDAIISSLTQRDKPRHMTFDSTTVSFSTIHVETEYNGWMAETIPLADGEWLFGVLDAVGRMEIITRKNCKMIVTDRDRLVVGKVVD